MIGEVIPLRERGKYQGALGAVFGVTTVLGPLLGGLFTDHLSWRWAFYVNVPIAIVVILLAARTIPGVRVAGVKPTIDYLGVLFVGLGASGLILATSWGGTEYAWGSATIIGLFLGSLICLAIFVFVELRAEEPILPMRLFRGRVFTMASILSFIVGFAMMGSITFLPTFLQFVSGASATSSGVRMLPMVIGLLVTAIASGSVVGRTGKYRMFPIAGAAITAIGLYLTSRLDQNTPLWLESAYFLVLGAGIGLIMQILTLIVQSTAEYRDLGTATSGVTFFRTLGGSFGAAVLGSIYSNQLVQAARGGRGIARAATRGGDQSRCAACLAGLGPGAGGERLRGVLADRVPLGGAGRAGRAGGGVVPAASHTAGPGHGRGCRRRVRDPAGRRRRYPTGERHRPGAEEEGRVRGARGVASVRQFAGHPHQLGVFGVYLRDAITGSASETSIERSVGVPHGVLRPFFDEIVAAGFLTRKGDVLRLTPEGRRQAQLITAAWRVWLVNELQEWLPAAGAEMPQTEKVDAALDRIVVRLVRESELEDAPA